jgi:dTDP-4-amino-4,6-dideoxygalactose transaminase
MRDTFLPFSPPLIDEEEIAAVVDTLRSDWITTGPKVRQFEEAFGQKVNSASTLAVSSCTDATLIALAALGIGPGDVVITTTMTFCSTVHVIEHLHATPVLVDIDPVTLNMDISRLSEALDANAGHVKAIIPVHHSGHPCDMDEIWALALRHEVAVIEDAAHAFPARYRGEIIGQPKDNGLPHAVAFSFYATKNMTTAEGGMLTGTSDLVDEARLWSLHGMSRDAWKRYGKGGSWFYEVIRPGFKCNMTDIQAALGLGQLTRIDSYQARRREISERYDAELAGFGLELPIRHDYVESAEHLYVVRLARTGWTIDRGAFIDALGERNIGASVHFIPVHQHPYYRDRYGFEPNSFPVAHEIFNRIASLPLNPRMSDDDVTDVIDAVKAVSKEAWIGG